ncbi:Receptor-type tyrosine-protein phosphatase alpha [Geodia barretti]|uniref:Receptor-type tyrosine-protein phosphatase alpha n=1 Tax=Geodia barretti TaxID=519541 RepID=A0AA35SFJ7_GEOBA|nr:Receptor-type tyrosine-protein phosphatase alpha [Geodia barretti]
MEGERVVFRVKVSGVPHPKLTWYHNGVEVAADYSRELGEDGTLSMPSAESKHSGVYKLLAVNRAGSMEKEVKLFVKREGEPSPFVARKQISFSPILVDNFGQYVASGHDNDNRVFRDQYTELDRDADHPKTIGTSQELKLLNRFGNITVYDNNRIALRPIEGHADCQRDFINACYVDVGHLFPHNAILTDPPTHTHHHQGYKFRNKFIATQGPLPKTVVDFWRLVWQEKPPTIVMVTNLKEGTKIKCQQYWPASGTRNFGPFQVTISEEQTLADYTTRTLLYRYLKGSSERALKVTQFHFTAWPDHGVPDYATPILAFHKKIRKQHRPSKGPLLVHCSAGVGRTGTLITIDRVLDQIAKEKMVDVAGVVQHLRGQRMKMVQNPVLEQVSPRPDQVPREKALDNPTKNRSDDFLPGDRWRVVLKGETEDYIHAVAVNGYKQQRAFIIAQSPMQSTARDFWKTVYDRKCGVLVMLCDLVESGKDVCYKYWPSSGVQQVGEYTIDMLGEEKLEGFTIRTFGVLHKKTNKSHQVQQIHIQGWRPDGQCSNLGTITAVIGEVTKIQQRTGNNPILVHCSDTASRSGMFCAIATTIERCKTEGVVDVFQVVKALRVQKPGAVRTVLVGSSRSSLRVTHFHFTAWPDHGVPDYATPILAFHKRVVKEHPTGKGPIMVHCSAGVGRTGTFITIDHVLEQLGKENVVDIPGVINKIRHQRMKLVQTVDQYIFIHNAILESVTCGDTQIASSDLRRAIQQMGDKGFAHQFAVLEQMSQRPDEVTANFAARNPDRNRSQEFLPADKWRVALRGDHPDYINAVFINVSNRNLNSWLQAAESFIIAQSPMQSTARDFWKMVYDRKCGVVVMLCADLVESGKETCYQYWPSSGTLTVGEFKVDLLGEELMDNSVLKTLSVTHSEVVKALRVQKPGAVRTVMQYKTIFEAVLVFLDSFDTYANF